MIDEQTACAIILIADMIYKDYEMYKLSPKEYYQITNIKEIIKKYTTENIDMIHAELNTHFE